MKKQSNQKIRKKRMNLSTTRLNLPTMNKRDRRLVKVRRMLVIKASERTTRKP